MKKTSALYAVIIEKGRWIFWTCAARLTEFAAHNRKLIYRVIAYGPMAAIAAVAFVLGRAVGMLLETSLF